MLKDFLSLSKEHEKSSTGSNNINHIIGPVVYFQKFKFTHTLGKIIYKLIICLIFIGYHTCKYIIENIK